MNADSTVLRLWYRLVQFGFRLLYNEFAFTYDWVSWFVSMGAWRCWVRSSLKHVGITPDQDEIVLEIAHGTGNLQVDLQKAGYRAVGVDLSPHMGRIAQRKLRSAQLEANLARVQAQALPFPDQTFSTVISTFPSDFILSSQTLSEVYRVLKTGGRFVIVPNATFTSRGIITKALDFLYRITGQREDSPAGAQPPRFNFTNYFAQFGFSVRVYQEPCPHSLVTVIVAEKLS